MTHIKFRETNMRKTNIDKLLSVNNIIEEYQEQGYVLTLRQLYYQLVSRDIIPNKQSEYAKLSTLLKEGRMSGMVDWNAIEDRLRQPHVPASFDGPESILRAAINQYELPRQSGQDIYLEVWVEKDALSGVLRRVTEKYHIPIMVNRGYSSVSAMYDAFMRFVNDGAYENRDARVLYLGDFDPSGLDMIRDIRERIAEFQHGYNDDTLIEEMHFDIEPIALTKSQIEQYNPPPNPAKITDPRAKNFIREHGDQSWEVDALKPNVLNDLLEESILNHIDEELYLSVIEKEEADKYRLKDLIEYL